MNPASDDLVAAARRALDGMCRAEQLAYPPSLTDEQFESGPAPSLETTSLALAALDAYDQGFFSGANAAESMVKWLCAGQEPEDPATYHALRMLAAGEAKPWNAGLRAWGYAPAMSDGSLARAAMAGLVRPPGDPRLVGEALALTSLTHADSKAAAAGVAMAMLVSYLIRARDASRHDVVVATARAVAPLDPSLSRALTSADESRAGARNGEPYETLAAVIFELTSGRTFCEWLDTHRVRSDARGGRRAAAIGLVLAAASAEVGDSDVPFHGHEIAEACRTRVRAAITREYAGPSLTIPPQPEQAAGINTCAIPLPPGCPAVTVHQSCAGCPVAEVQGRARHSDVSRSSFELQEAARAMASVLLRGEDAVDDVARNAVELYTRSDIEGNSLAKGVLFAIRKRLQVLYGAEDAHGPAWELLCKGEELAGWPEGWRERGPTFAQMFGTHLEKY